MSDDSKNTDGSQSAEGSQMAEDSQKAEDSQSAEGSQLVEDSQHAEGSVIEDPDVLASLQQLSMAEANESVQTASAYSPEPFSSEPFSSERIKNIVEAAVMAASKAISIDKILMLFPETEIVDREMIRQAIEQLMKDYQSRGVELIEVSSGFRFQVAQTVAPWVSRLWEERPQKYSRALLETLALVAYRQPVTRGEIEEIRGVSVSSQIMRTLVEREWVRVIGHRDVPGKPAMYATTKTFLDYFGLKKLDELPALSEIRDLDVINAELDFGELNGGDQGEGDQSEDDQDKDDQNKDVQGKTEADNEAGEGSELNITLSVDSEQSEDFDEILVENRDDNLNEAANETPYEDASPSERIDIDAELSALKETYQQIDAIEKKNEEQDSIDKDEK